VSVAVRRPEGLAGPFALSFLLHAAVVGGLIVWRAAPSAPLPPMSRVDLVAAPAGERQAGVVRETPAPATPTKAPPKAATNEATKAAPIDPPSRRARPQTRASTNITEKAERVSPTTAPTAGGGDTGGAGTDVATVRTEGIDFPFPGYLANTNTTVE
jgi:protein TonB